MIIMNNYISSLVNFYLEKNYIDKQDIVYCCNRVAALIGEEEVIYNEDAKPNLYSSLKSLVNIAIKNNRIEDFVYSKEVVESKITDIFIEKPSKVQKMFESNDIVSAYTNFYNQCVDTNYIKANDLAKNIHFKRIIEDNPIEISINLAKPEKDPIEIEKLLHVKSTSYPKCLLCVENVGFEGNVKHPARTNHRVINLKLNNQDWVFQYSPYLYYNYHCILIEKKHRDMKITDNTIKIQLDFIDKFKNFFIGNNASIPIVGGSILDHNHFQGGIYTFPINHAKTLFETNIDNVKIEYLSWHLTTLRLTTDSKDKMISSVNRIRSSWINYSNEVIINNNNNSLNYICRKSDDLYEVLIIFRNNSTSDEFPDGIYHPSPEYFHIKKENIGLIEAMGLAILPARLLEELDEVKSFIKDNIDINNSIHYNWAKKIKAQYTNQNIDEYIEDEIAKRFVDILKCCDVLKYCSNKEEIIKEIIR